MTRRRSMVWWRVALGGLIVAGALGLLRPWTIRPIETATAPVFDAAAYVDSIWESRVIAPAEASAVDLDTLLKAPPSSRADGQTSPRATFAKGIGVVAEVDRRFRVGLAWLRKPGAKGQTGVAIQMGPVLRGTALRDALPFIRFTDFVNQLEFASVASALNEQVSQRVLNRLDLDRLSGQTVSFVGAVSVDGANPDATLVILPVLLQVVEGVK